MVEIYKFKNGGAGILTGSVVRFIQKRMQRYWLELLESLPPNISVKMGSTFRLLVNCRSMEVSNLLEFLKYGVADCLILSISELTLGPHGGTVFPIITIRSWEEVSIIS